MSSSNRTKQIDLSFQVGGLTVNFNKNHTVLVCGSTGSGKSYFLKHIWKQLSTNYRGKVKFVFIDLKMVEYNNIIEDGKLFPVCLETSKVDGIINDLLNKSYDLPVVVFWDVFEDYLFFNNTTLSKFKRLLSEGPKKRVYTIACSSTVAMGREYTDLFSTIFVGSWPEENVDEAFGDHIKMVISRSDVDLSKLKRGEFVVISGYTAQSIEISR